MDAFFLLYVLVYFLKKVMLILVLFSGYDYWLAFAVLASLAQNLFLRQENREELFLHSEVKLLRSCLHKIKKNLTFFQDQPSILLPTPSPSGVESTLFSVWFFLWHQKTCGDQQVLRYPTFQKEEPDFHTVWEERNNQYFRNNRKFLGGGWWKGYLCNHYNWNFDCTIPFSEIKYSHITSQCHH